MKRSTLALLIVASALVIAGSVIFALAMTMTNWDFSSLDTSKYSQNIHVIKNDFNNISIDVKSADIIFIRSQDEKASVISYEKEKLQIYKRNTDSSASVFIGCGNLYGNYNIPF